MPKLLAFIQYLRSLAVHFIFPHFFSTWVQMFISSSKLRKCLLFSMAPRFRGEARTAYPRRLGVRCSSFCTSCCSSSSSWKDNGTNNGNATKKFMGFWICVSIYYIIIYIYDYIFSINHRVEIHDEDLSTWNFTYQCGDVQKWSQMIWRLKRSVWRMSFRGPWVIISTPD